jgi:molybdenum transport protein
MSYKRCWLSTDELQSLLREDAPYGDLTSTALGIDQHLGRIHFHARDAMVVCGVEESARMFELAGADVDLQASSGDYAQPGRPLLSASGEANALFLVWKVAQSLMESLAGISTCAQGIVDQCAEVPVACTRKHLPSTKTMMVKAILAGGAIMHRLGLSESIMVTAEHRTFLDNKPLHTCLERIKRTQPEKKCVVEVDKVETALSLLELKCDVIQLEKLIIDDIVKVVTAAKHHSHHSRPLIIAAGGINPGNASVFAATGVDMIVTSAPYFAKPRDIQVTFETS